MSNSAVKTSSAGAPVSDDGIDSGRTKWYLWSLALTRGHTWEKIDLFEVVYWFRQIIGVLLGIVAGTLQATGLPGLAFGMCFLVVVPYAYVWFVLGVDVEAVGPFEVVTEGFLPAYASYLLFWIAVYSLPIPS